MILDISEAVLLTIRLKTIFSVVSSLESDTGKYDHASPIMSESISEGVGTYLGTPCIIHVPGSIHCIAEEGARLPSLLGFYVPPASSRETLEPWKCGINTRDDFIK